MIVCVYVCVCESVCVCVSVCACSPPLLCENLVLSTVSPLEDMWKDRLLDMTGEERAERESGARLEEELEGSSLIDDCRDLGGWSNKGTIRQ